MTQEREERLRTLYDDHFDRVIGYLMRIGVPRDDAREIAQDAFMRIYENMDRVSGSPVVYLYTSARNLARNRLRDAHALKRYGISVSLDSDLASQAPSAESIGGPETCDVVSVDEFARRAGSFRSVSRADELERPPAALEDEYDDSAPLLWQSVVDLGASLPSEEWDRVPTDFASNLDHYLYGRSGEEE